MNKKKKTILILIGILLVGSIAIGVSYAYWRLSLRQESTNRYTSSCFNVSVDLDEDTPITLNNAYPKSDEEGMKLEPYTFTIENTCDSVVNYSIQLNVLNESTLDSKYVKYSVGSNDISIVGLKNTVEAKINHATAYEINTGKLSKGQKQDIKLRMWIDQYTPQSEGMSKEFSAKIVVDTSATKVYADASGAEAPVLDNGMIPVIWNGTDWIKADTFSRWYDYGEQWWANAVTVSSATRKRYTLAEVGTEIKMDDIETMWVWIPRYEYQHTNLGEEYAGGTKELPGGITINFISKETITPSSNNYIVHDAFWWDDNNNGTKDSGEQLSGIWVAKFELSPDIECTAKNNSPGEGCDLNTITPHSKPNKYSWTGAYIATYWTVIHEKMNGENNSYGLTNSDAHLIKNMEWGAVAYLSQSKYGKYGNPNYEGANKEIYSNNTGKNYINHRTGCSSGSSLDVDLASYCFYTYDQDIKGTGASTTGNIYGIYDMNAGAKEYVMGIPKIQNGEEPDVGNTGFSGKSSDGTNINGRYGDLKTFGSKYYDLYEYAKNTNDNMDERYHPGDATFETGGWYSDELHLVSYNTILTRSGSTKIRGGIFFVYPSWNGAATDETTRAVAVPLK